MSAVSKRVVQVEMEFRTWGGKRRGAGRPAKKPWRPSERHKERERFSATRPFHVTVRVVEAVGKLRRRDAYHAIRRAMHVTLTRTNFRIVHISLENDHIHLIVEADNEKALARGMQAFEISAAMRINKLFAKREVRRRNGQVFPDRYHAVAITSPTQARNAMAYVLNNWRRHKQDDGMETRLWDVDYFSSGPSFRGWKELETSPEPFQKFAGYEPLPVARPQTWLLGAGWRKAGKPISLHAVPGPAAR